MVASAEGLVQHPVAIPRRVSARFRREDEATRLPPGNLSQFPTGSQLDFAAMARKGLRRPVYMSQSPAGSQLDFAVTMSLTFATTGIDDVEIPRRVSARFRRQPGRRVVLSSRRVEIPRRVSARFRRSTCTISVVGSSMSQSPAGSQPDFALETTLCAYRAGLRMSQSPTASQFDFAQEPPWTRSPASPGNVATSRRVSARFCRRRRHRRTRDELGLVAIPRRVSARFRRPSFSNY